MNWANTTYIEKIMFFFSPWGNGAWGEQMGWLQAQARDLIRLCFESMQILHIPRSGNMCAL